jgi:site-specific recombinase XerD
METRSDAELVEAFCETLRPVVAPSTWYSYRIDLRQLVRDVLPACGLPGVRALTRTAMAQVVAHLRERYLVSTVSRKVAAYRRFAEWLVAHDVLRRDPTRGFTFAKSARSAEEIPEDVLADLCARPAWVHDRTPAHLRWLKLRDEALFRVMTETGAGSADVTAMVCEDADTVAGMARIAGLWVEVSAEANRALVRYKAEGLGHKGMDGPGRPLFPSNEGGPMTRAGLSVLLLAYGRLEGLTEYRLSARAIRRSFVLRMARLGMEPDEIAARARMTTDAVAAYLHSGRRHGPQGLRRTA